MDGCLLLACMVGNGTLFSTHMYRSENIFGCEMGKGGGGGERSFVYIVMRLPVVNII